MKRLFIQSKGLVNHGTLEARDDHNQLEYLINRHWGMHQTSITVHTLNGREMARLTQENNADSPIILQQNEQQVGTLMAPPLLPNELLFIRGLTWIVLGNVDKKRYRIFNSHTLVATVKPVALSQDQTTLISFNHDDPNQTALVIALVVFLDRYLSIPKRQSVFTIQPGFNFSPTLVPHLKITRQPWQYTTR